jgi:hypothetical protein
VGCRAVVKGYEFDIEKIDVFTVDEEVLPAYFES